MIQAMRCFQLVLKISRNSEIGGRIYLSNKIQACRGSVVIQYHGFDIMDIKAQGISEQQNQKKRDSKGQIKASGIP